MRLRIFEYLFTYYFRPHVIKQGLSLRKGECKHCGQCCRNLIGIKGFNCPFLKGNICRIYRWRHFIPILKATCCTLPISIEKWSFKEGCGYYR